MDRSFLFGVALLAYLVRLVPVLTGGGLAFYGRYDDSVYYSAADALTFGRLPYKNFTLLHPPLLMLVLTPFALLGRLTTDAVGFGVARLAFMGIGAVNTVLVTLIARRWGKVAAVVAGLMYASWLPAVYGEQSTMLEPLGTTALCVALLMLLRGEAAPRRLHAIVAGSALGLATTDKIWYVAPLVAILVWQLAARRYRVAAWMAAAAAVAMTVVIVPFAVLTRGRMWDMVIRDQLFRPQIVASRFQRLTSILGLHAFGSGRVGYLDALTVVGVVVVVVACIACLRAPNGRVLVWILAVNLAVLMQAPPFYQHYAALTAAPATLVAAVAASRLEQLPRPWMRTGLATALALIVLSAGAVISTPTGHVFPSAFGRIAPPGCTTSDTPEALIDMNRLSRDLRQGCPLPVDVTGITYDRLAGTTHRRLNLPWQRYLVTYLRSGSSFVVARGKYDEIAPAFRLDLDSRVPIATADHLKLRVGDDPGKPA
ncbi:MAG: ArnT family glycosyltransferase [Mycobacteriales bacterium]